MNLFMPYTDVAQIAKSFSGDKKRFRAQLNEARGILKTLQGEGKMKHPIVEMLRGEEVFLEHYILAFQEVLEGKEPHSYKLPEKFIEPVLQGLHAQRLFSKNPEVFAQFKSFDILPEAYSIYYDSRQEFPWRIAIKGKWLSTESARKNFSLLKEIILKAHLSTDECKL